MRRNLLWAVVCLFMLTTASVVRADTQTFVAQRDTWVGSGGPNNNLGNWETVEIGGLYMKNGQVQA
ncbi:MAG TPA: hypothetical protein ENO19_03885, partial [Halothiobacillaceae bacterium]|nr:hypothetical protein [Halothiobacillaceae bacterium]